MISITRYRLWVGKKVQSCRRPPPAACLSHPDRENIFAVGSEERRTMVRKLFVELERLWACDDDASAAIRQRRFLKDLPERGRFIDGLRSRVDGPVSDLWVFRRICRRR